jgi:tetratricopeptide (TPR) repeat protein
MIQLYRIVRFLAFAISAPVLLLSCSAKQESSSVADSAVVLKGLDGREFFVPAFPVKTRLKLDSNLQIAKTNFDKEATEENYVWLGRREAYLYNYKKAIDVFSEGIKRYPDSYKLYRHRGHRYITLRNFDRAVADLQKAKELMPESPLEIEPDGQPNKLNTPLSSTQFNVWYHLALAHYLRGDFENALEAYQNCMKTSVNDDLVCATIDWQYMTLRKLNRKEEAEKILTAIRKEMNIIENDSYHKRLLMYKGLVPPDSVLNVNAGNEDQDLALATQGYGVGNWYLYNGDTTKARVIFDKVVNGKHFSAFGFIASEVEFKKLGPIR